MLALRKTKLWLVRNFAGSLLLGWVLIAAAGWSAMGGQSG